MLVAMSPKAIGWDTKETGMGVGVSGVWELRGKVFEPSFFRRPRGAFSGVPAVSEANGGAHAGVSRAALSVLA